MNYYEILGVPRDASQKDIKQAFRKLAMEYHPDRNSNYGAEAKFKEINEAYAVLSNRKQRENYNRHGYADEKFRQGLDLEIWQNQNPEAVPWTIGDIGKATLLTIVSTVAIIGLLVVFFALFALSGSDWVLESWFILLIAGLPLYALMLLAVWLFSVRKYRCGWRALGFRNSNVKGLLLGASVVLMGIAVGSLYDFIIVQTGADSPSSLPADFVGTWYNWTMLGLFAMVVAPIAEETFFRGFMLPGISKRFGKGWGIVVSAFIFALAHLQPGAMVPIFLLGLLLAWLYIKTKSIWPCIFAHFTYNSIAFIFMIIS